VFGGAASNNTVILITQQIVPFDLPHQRLLRFSLKEKQCDNFKSTRFYFAAEVIHPKTPIHNPCFLA
jgi:hypothetical protein